MDVSSTSGNLIVTEDGGRQTVTYNIPPGEFSDDISYRIHVGWIYFLIQFWVYPTIVLILLVLFTPPKATQEKGEEGGVGQPRSQHQQGSTRGR